MSKSWIVRFLGIFSVLTLALSACAQDEEPTPTGTGTSAAEDPKLAKACDANAKINSGFNRVFEGLPEPEGPPTPEAVKQIQERMDREVMPHIETIEDNAPEAISDDLKTAVKAVRDFREKPDPEFFEQEEIDQAIAGIDEYFFEECDYEKVTVQAKEYEFANVPEEVKSGDLGVKLENEGKEVHEFAVLTKEDGVTESFDQILAMPEEEAQRKVKFVGGTDAEPGDEGFAVVTFEEPGDYLAVCFIPQGTTGDEQVGGAAESPQGTASPGISPTVSGSPGAGGEQEAPPHFTLGMKKEFKVI